MKKYWILLLIVPLVVFGCAKKKPIIEYNQEAHDNILNAIGKTTENQVVVKKSKGNYLEYYVYEIKNINFTLYDYTFYNTKAEYNEAISKYKENLSLELNRDDEALVTKVLIQNGTNSDETKDLRETIINKYKDDKEYEIIE